MEAVSGESHRSAPFYGAPEKYSVWKTQFESIAKIVQAMIKRKVSGADVEDFKFVMRLCLKITFGRCCEMVRRQRCGKGVFGKRCRCLG